MKTFFTWSYIKPTSKKNVVEGTIFINKKKNNYEFSIHVVDNETDSAIKLVNQVRIKLLTAGGEFKTRKTKHISNSFQMGLL